MVEVMHAAAARALWGKPDTPLPLFNDNEWTDGSSNRLPGNGEVRGHFPSWSEGDRRSESCRCIYHRDTEPPGAAGPLGAERTLEAADGRCLKTDVLLPRLPFRLLLHDFCVLISNES
ncbi:hypothetical protein EYF80_009198 [Liparis tanakae]|uniref:Uncharacterized protein n=1 Tax=Liparis tanakae TaxID=230148 RepID=A0A4Z2IR53_9TELE|nr:hypothetical protein EYF80_009198 [Liparis tanakae]